MTLNTQTNEPRYSGQASSSPELSTKAWTWKKHALLLIALVCLVFWLCGSQIKTASWLPEANKWLPLIGSLAFAGETMLKLIQ